MAIADKPVSLPRSDRATCLATATKLESTKPSSPVVIASNTEPSGVVEPRMAKQTSKSTLDAELTKVRRNTTTP